MARLPEISKVDCLTVPFLTSSGISTPQSVEIHFKEEFQGTKSLKLGYYNREQLFKMLENKQEILIDECYIDFFSLADFRTKKDIDKKELIELKSFSANNSWFNASTIFDFSYTLLTGDFSAENSWFLKGQLSLHALQTDTGNISFAGSHFNLEKLDFANAHLGSGNLSFKNTIFKKGFKDFQYCNFGDGEIIFTNADFGDGDVSFINSSFGDCDVSFKVARFGDGKTDFHYAHFSSGDVNFERTDFGNGIVDFRKVEWANNRINFNRSVFGIGNVSFEESELKQGKLLFKKASMRAGGFVFSLALFENIEVIFDGTDFGKSDLHFNGSEFLTLSLKGCHLDNYVDLRVKRAQLLDLSDTIIRDIVDMKPIENEVKIETLQFEGMRLIGSVYIGWNENQVLSLISKQKNTSLMAKAEQFRTLKQNFNKTGQYDDEDEAYVYFKRYEAKARLKSKLKKGPFHAIEAWPSYAFKWLVFDKIGLYATSPVRVLVSIIFIYLSFGFILFMGQYTHIGSITSAVGNPDHLSNLSQAFYHSAITFFTIGYGDTFPQGFDRVISAFEGFVGVFMMSYFTVAFVRKILR